jgi:2-amino-4-hydroxy-6-hydroxymethyldihydropteridine diphosphokinase
MTILRRIHIGLGANLGKPQETIQIALAELASWAQAHEIHAQFRHSKLYRSTSIGAPGPDYINAVAEFNSRLGADEILAEIQNIEKRFGRTRSFPNAPRTLDLDLLLINDALSYSSHSPSYNRHSPWQASRFKNYCIKLKISIAKSSWSPIKMTAHRFKEVLPC